MEWKYYNHAAIPTCAPHEIPDITSVKNGDIWKIFRRTPVLARWTTDFDCGYETNWWYVIKDTAFDIAALKAKRRYEIKKGIKNFEVRRILNPQEYAEEFVDVQVDAFSAYPSKYRPVVDRAKFKRNLVNWAHDRICVYGAFSRQDGRLCGYAYLMEEERVLHFNVLKTRPSSEKFGVNAAIVYKILLDFNDKLEKGLYICDGARSILHETAFQDYLEKYFGFRKAYCKLHIAYNPRYRGLLSALYHCRSLLRKFDNFGLIHKVNGVMAMQVFLEEQKVSK